MNISESKTTYKDGFLVYSVNVISSEGSKKLWYSLNEEYANLLSDRSDAALVALLIPAMALGEDIHIKGVISSRLYYNISRPYQHVLRKIIPSLHQINIYPEEVQPANKEGSGVAMGFSAGIDSFCALADHFYSDVPEGFRLTHLFFNNVGSHGHGKNGVKLYKERYKRAKLVADHIGLPLIDIDTNLYNFYSGLGFQQTHTPRNASVAHLLQRGICRFFYASTFPYENVYIGPIYDMAYSDTITLPLLSTESIDMISVGSEYTRVEKTLKVATIEDSYSALDICVKGSRNCSTCWKCKRTILTLEIAGLLDRYSNVFDFDAYQKVRNLYIAEVLQSHDPLLSEICEFMKGNDFRIPISSRLLVPYARLKYSAKKTAIQAAKRAPKISRYVTDKILYRP